MTDWLSDLLTSPLEKFYGPLPRCTDCGLPIPDFKCWNCGTVNNPYLHPTTDSATVSDPRSNDQ